MINKVYDSFFKATQVVSKLILDVSAIESSSIAKAGNEDGLSISIDIVGELTGKVLYHFPQSTSLKIVNVMSGKELYQKRKETIERVFADAKKKHAMRYTPYRGLAQVRNWVKLKFIAMNLRKFAKRKWLENHPQPLSMLFYQFVERIFKNPTFA